MNPPRFWTQGGMLAGLLSPFSWIAAAVTARRLARPGWRAPVKVICCGNISVGGAGKTTLALDLGARLQRRGAHVAFISRGYGGRALHAVQVALDDDAATVGDEALLLAAVAPTFVGADRATSAQAAVAAGATVLVMDDGLQNPGLVQDLKLLVVDGAVGFGNGRVLPAGPLREPVAAGVARCQAAVLIGPDATGAAVRFPIPVLRAALVPDGAGLAGRRVLAFAGIGRPSKFFATLAQTSAVIVGQESFPDHHRYSARQLAGLRRRAAAADATLVTTPKDAVRLPAAFRAEVVVAGVSLHWEDEAAIEALLEGCL
jgi:tetraacyldisaccharide 4'-kinase